MSPRHPAILGPGLLGGSIALALREADPSADTRLWGRREEAAAAARDLGIARTATTDLETAVSGADLVILCVPVGAMPDLARRILPFLAPDSAVTDVGSVKAPVVNALEPILGGRFAGSHPMAGSERAGIEAARADLFRGAVSILTPTPTTAPQAAGRTRALWESLGCAVRSLSPEAHDRTVALVSHLPHLLAAALVDFVCLENRDALNFCGTGFKDTTRVASGPAEMWTEILFENRDAMKAALRSFARHAEAIDRLFDDPPALRTFLSRAAAARDGVPCSTARPD